MEMERFSQMVREFPEFHSERKKWITSVWRLFTISEKIFRKIAFSFDLKPKFPDFVAKW